MSTSSEHTRLGVPLSELDLLTRENTIVTLRKMLLETALEMELPRSSHSLIVAVHEKTGTPHVDVSYALMSMEDIEVRSDVMSGEFDLLNN